MSEGDRGRGVRAGRGWGQVVQGLVGLGEDLGFYPQGGGSPGGLWAEEGPETPQKDKIAQEQVRSWVPYLTESPPSSREGLICWPHFPDEIW